MRGGRDATLEVPLAAPGRGWLIERKVLDAAQVQVARERLIVPPVPAASRPSNSTARRWPVCRIHSCAFSNSIRRNRFAASYYSRLSLSSYAEASFQLSTDMSIFG